MRRLAHIEVISDIRPIEGADKIEVAHVLGWECVVKRGEFKVGEKVIYVEIDSVMPEKPEYEFLRSRNFRIRTIKLRGQVSQGLVLPLSALGKNADWDYIGYTGQDVTKELGIKKYLSPSELNEQFAEAGRRAKKRSKIHKFMMRYSWFRKLVLKKNQNKGWPQWVAKTDEERIQNIPEVLQKFADKEVYVAEKIDCLDQNTMLITNYGVKSIKTICESTNKFKVLSQDTTTGCVEFKPIINKMIKDHTNKRWLKITLEDDSELLVTEDHHVYIPELKCYRKAMDLTENDFLLKIC